MCLRYLSDAHSDSSAGLQIRQNVEQNVKQNIPAWSGKGIKENSDNEKDFDIYFFGGFYGIDDRSGPCTGNHSG